MNQPESSEKVNRLAANTYSRYAGFTELGQGSVGKVEGCFDPNLHRRIAMKTLHPQCQEDEGQKARFIREARLMASVEHPNVLPIYEVGLREDGSFYFTMKEVHGIPLSKILDGLFHEDAEMQAVWSFQALLDVFLQVCNAVSFAHSKGVIHRDLKPDNVLVGMFGEVIVLDWGLARSLEESDVLLKRHDEESMDQDSFFGKTLDGVVMGTPDFMAPEQARGEVANHDFRTDVYALGGILYEILTLQSPVRSLKLKDILEEVGGDTEIQSPREAMKHSGSVKRASLLYPVPRELDAICMKALAKHPDHRYQQVADLTHDLQAWRNHESVAVCPDSHMKRIIKWLRRQPFFVAIVGTGLAVWLAFWASLFVMDHLRRNDFVEQGDRNRMKGSSLVHDSLLPILQWRQTVEQTPLKAKELEGLKRSIDTQVRDIKAAYEIALVLYAQASRGVADQRVLSGNREIHANYLRMALLLGDKDEAKLRLDIIRNWTGTDFQGSHGATREWLQNISAWCEKAEKVNPMTLVNFTDEERSMITAAGLSLPFAEKN